MLSERGSAKANWFRSKGVLSDDRFISIYLEKQFLGNNPISIYCNLLPYNLMETIYLCLPYKALETNSFLPIPHSQSATHIILGR